MDGLGQVAAFDEWLGSYDAQNDAAKVTDYAAELSQVIFGCAHKAFNPETRGWSPGGDGRAPALRSSRVRSSSLRMSLCCACPVFPRFPYPPDQLRVQEAVLFPHAFSLRAANASAHRCCFRTRYVVTDSMGNVRPKAFLGDDRRK